MERREGGGEGKREARTDTFRAIPRTCEDCVPEELCG